MRIEVEGCMSCPFLHAPKGVGRCQDQKEIPPTNLLMGTAPAWCPLRTGDVTVGLKREAKDD